MRFKPGEPKAVDNSAAVIYAELALRFRSKIQLDAFIKLLLKEQDRPHFEVKTADDGDDFTVTVYDICWGANLVRIAKLAANVDYNGG